MDKFLERLIKKTDRQFSIFEKLLYTAIIDYLIDTIKLEDGKITANNQNNHALSTLEKASERMGGAWQKVVSFVLNGITSFFIKSLSHYAKIDTRAIEQSKGIKDRLEDHSATTVNTVMSLEVIYAEIKQKAIALMSRPNGVSLKEMREELEKTIVVKGIAKKYYSRWTHDIYSQYQRIATNELRKEIGLIFAFYQNGLIESSRSFCKERNGKIFHEEQIMSWASLDWEGKPDTGYDPIADLGGYNCRHRLDWISSELAFRLRPDLKEKYSKDVP